MKVLSGTKTILAHKKMGVQKLILVIKISLNDGLGKIKSEIIQRLQKVGNNLDQEVGKWEEGGTTQLTLW